MTLHDIYGENGEIIAEVDEPETGTVESKGDDWTRPSAHIQWKGTDVCMDFHCLCDTGEEVAGVGHFDGYFAYHVRCARCGRVYRLPTELLLVEVDPDEEPWCNPMDIYPDEEEGK